MKLVAKTRLKFGSRVAATDHRGAVVAVADTRSVMPGEIFEADADLANKFLKDGIAMTRTQALDKARGIQERGEFLPEEYAVVVSEGALTAEERYHDALAEARAAGLRVKVPTEGVADPS